MLGVVMNSSLKTSERSNEFKPCYFLNCKIKKLLPELNIYDKLNFANKNPADFYFHNDIYAAKTCNMIHLMPPSVPHRLSAAKSRPPVTYTCPGTLA